VCILRAIATLLRSSSFIAALILRDQFLDGLALYVLTDALFVQELREARADAALIAFHHSTSFSRFRAKSKSALGVA